jgi:uncharacterized membrane protein YphA (DoxX/SURF4 family)
MESLNLPAKTSVWFLIAAGAIMVYALFTSKKARKVLQTSIDLSSQQDDGNELFGTSTIARNMVRLVTKTVTAVTQKTPQSVKDWIGKRFTPLEKREDVAFDLVRASVNLVLAGLLIALGTSLKLPLSTTYVTFMVGMGSSLADRAWGRESAVYRVTGVVSVVGGWFITAGAAFILAALVATIFNLGGVIAMYIMIAAYGMIAIGSVQGDGSIYTLTSAKRRIALTTPISAPPAINPEAMSVPFSVRASLSSLSLLRLPTYHAIAPPTSIGVFKSIGMNMPSANGRAGTLKNVRRRAMTAPIP